MLPIGSIFILYDFKFYFNVLGLRAGKSNRCRALFAGGFYVKTASAAAKARHIGADKLKRALYGDLNGLG